MYNEKIDLSNYNDVNKINIIRQGYHINETKEWIYNNVVYNQNKEYGYSDFCELSSSDCEITLYANWEPNTVTIQYNVNGGELASEHGEKISLGENGLITYDGNTTFEVVSYENSLSEKGLSNYNSKEHINIQRDGYYIVKGEEWIDENGNTYDQTIQYSAEELYSNLKNESKVITLYANWKSGSDTSSITVIDNNYAKIENNLIYIKIKNEQSNYKDKMLSNLRINGSYKIYDSNNNEIINNNSLVGTSSRIILENGSTYNIIVLGDVNKDGELDTSDLVGVFKKMMNKITLDNNQLIAADYNQDSELDVSDLVGILKKMMGQ